MQGLDSVDSTCNGGAMLDSATANPEYYLVTLSAMKYGREKSKNASKE